MLAVVILAAGMGTAAPRPGWCYTPDSPEVQEMLKRATAYLEQQPAFGEVGGECLIALALVKAGYDTGHARVQGAIRLASALAEKAGRSGITNHCYNETIACIFMCEVAPEQCQAQIGTMLQVLLRLQRPNGCWSYNPYQYDDTSQTQYGILCLWAAHHHKFPVPADAVERALNWVMRVQDANSGGWVYVSRYPQTPQRVPQSPVTHPMAAAGLGSLYVCAQLLGFGADAKPKGATPEEEKLPPALQRVEEKKRKDIVYLQPQSTNIAQVRESAAAGNAWFSKNLRYDIDTWTHYYMYGLERAMSFRELVEGKTEAEPDWYNKGVEYLRGTQSSAGNWTTKLSHGSGPAVDTAFAVLFLTRSAQKSIRKAVLDEGTLIGGKGLPKNIANVRMEGGKVVTPQMVRDVDDLLKLLEQSDNTEFDATSLPGNLSLDQDLTKRTSQLQRLRELVTVESYEARLAAVKTLARARDLDNVPVLIFALGDPDAQVVAEAREGLRFISRRLEGLGPPPNPTPEQKQEAQRQWKQWYLSIRPDAELLE